jgi:transmembrane sensor
MSNDTVKTRAIIQEANEWLLRMLEPGASAADEAGFAAWLRQSPMHVREYLRAEAVYAAMAGVDAEKRIDVGALLRQEQGNVVELRQAGVDWASGAALSEGEDWSGGPGSRAGGPDRQDTDGSLSQGIGHGSRTRLRKGSGRLQSARSPRRHWTAAAGIVAAIAAGAALYIQSTAPDVYATALGEQRRVVLQDGSRVDMNTDTELSVRIDDAGRYVELLKGEALFTVAKDLRRPFVVDGDLARVRALGTQFNVYRDSQQVLITVIEGRVAVEQDTARRTPAASGEVATIDLPAMELAAGDQAAIGLQEPMRKTVANTERTVAWRERRLIFENQPLSEVVAEFNRYNRRQLVIEDPQLARERISAVFDADQPEALVRFLTQNTPIRLIDDGEAQLVLRAAE